ncbi:MAG: TIGR03808 family TAT-translocated repetitive protein, partial [Xanthobacteraceae bacterium]
MIFNRRRLVGALAGAASAGSAGPVLGREAPAREVSARASIDGASLGLRPDSSEDQSKILQRAIDHATSARAVLRLAPGAYRAGALTLRPHGAIAGVAGATRLVLVAGSPLMSAAASDYIGISGLIFDGAEMPLQGRQGLIDLAHGRSARITDCEIVNAGGNGISLTAIEGEVRGNTVSASDAAIFSIDAA